MCFYIVVLCVMVIDWDKDVNGLVYYNIISGNSCGYFVIDSFIGEI